MSRRKSPRRGGKVAVEMLELRCLLAGPGYVLSGNSWANPQEITFSIAPDGTYWDHGTNNLNATLNAEMGPGVWQRALARALQTWAVVANINFVQVADSGLAENVSGQDQGDPRFGDIRIGGYAFFDPNTLAQTFFAPPNGQTASGDTEINTAINWRAGGTDLFSVMLHEFGHSLGLDHTNDPQEVMNPVYEGVRNGLGAGDIAGIQAIYGARPFDVYQSHGLATSAVTAADLTSGLNAFGQETVAGLSLATIGDVEYFSVVAPAGSAMTLVATAQAGGVSLLSPSISIYDTSGHLLSAQANGLAYGDNVSASVGQVAPGQRYIIAVTGATGDVFSVGAYHLQVAFAGATPPPVIVPPPVVTPPPAPVPLPVGPFLPTVWPDRFEPNDLPGQATPLGFVSQTALTGLSFHTATDVDTFQLVAARAGNYQVAAPGAVLRLVDGRGRLVAQGLWALSFHAGRAGTRYVLTATSSLGVPIADYSLAIALQAMPRRLGPRPRVRIPRGV